MKNYLLDRSRKIIKSIGKIEYKIQDKITFNISKNKNKNILKDKDFKNFLLSQNKPNKMAIVICFYFTKKRLEKLKFNILNINKYNFKTNVTIITNNISKIDQKKIHKILKNKIKNYSIVIVKDYPDDNFLPWPSVDVMKEKIKDTSYSHFMFLEDDIIVSNENISYWLYFRKILKKYNLIPNFLRNFDIVSMTSELYQPSI